MIHVEVYDSCRQFFFSMLASSKKKKTSPAPNRSSTESTLFVFPNYDLPTGEHDESQVEVEWDACSPVTMCKYYSIHWQ